MNIQILNIKEPSLFGRGDTFSAVRISYAPDRRYAVAEIIPNELFVAVKIIRFDGDMPVGEYVDYYEFDNCIPMAIRFTVLWGYIKYGFCKLNLYAPEKVNEFGGSLDKTVKRFYFDRDLYKRSYEEINGVPCKKRDCD